jgi:hypothetical protein
VVQAATLERVGQLAGPVRGEHDHRRPLGPDRAELGDRDLEVAEQLEQEGLELVVGAVDLVDEQDRAVAELQRAQQRSGEQEAGRVELVLVVGGRSPDARAPAGAAAAAGGPTRRAPGTGRSPRGTAAGRARPRGPRRAPWPPRSCRPRRRPRAAADAGARARGGARSRAPGRRGRPGLERRAEGRDVRWSARGRSRPLAVEDEPVEGDVDHVVEGRLPLVGGGLLAGLDVVADRQDRQRPAPSSRRRRRSRPPPSRRRARPSAPSCRTARRVGRRTGRRCARCRRGRRAPAARPRRPRSAAGRSRRSRRSRARRSGPG